MLDQYPSLRADWSYPTAVRFGPGRIVELPEALKSAGISRPLFVTDPGLVNLPIVVNALAILKKANVPVAVFSKVDGNPTLANLNDGIAAYKAGGHDGVIVFGGGSAMDVGKTIAFMSGQTRSVFDFEDREDWWTRADANGIAPIVAVPTTAGTGSEVGRASVITDPTDHTKKIIFHPVMLPKVVIADPELTLDLPAKITGWTGMDALSHSLESYCSPFFHPLGEGIALEGLRLCKEWLPVAVEDGHNINGRAFVLAASSMGAVAFQKFLGDGVMALFVPFNSGDNHAEQAIAAGRSLVEKESNNLRLVEAGVRFGVGVTAPDRLAALLMAIAGMLGGSTRC